MSKTLVPSWLAFMTAALPPYQLYHGGSSVYCQPCSENDVVLLFASTIRVTSWLLDILDWCEGVEEGKRAQDACSGLCTPEQGQRGGSELSAAVTSSFNVAGNLIIRYGMICYRVYLVRDILHMMTIFPIHAESSLELARIHSYLV
jgi:hypothetical protein